MNNIELKIKAFELAIKHDSVVCTDVLIENAEKIYKSLLKEKDKNTFTKYTTDELYKFFEQKVKDDMNRGNFY